MADQVSVEIRAVDKVTEDLQAISKSMRKSFKEIETAFSASTRSMANTAKSNFGEIKKSIVDATKGTNQMAKDVKGVAVESKKTVASIKGIQTASIRAGKSANSNFRRMSNMVDRFGRKVRFTNRSIGAMSKAFRATRRSSSGLSRSMANLSGAVTGLKALLVGGLFSEFIGGTVRAMTSVEALENRMRAAIGPFGNFGKELNRLRAFSDEMGLDFRQAANDFAGFAAAATRSGLSMDQTRQIFSDVSTAVTSLRLPTEQAGRAFQALQQISSKGKVSMEELRQQLSESLPGAVQIAADSMGMTSAAFQDAVAKGEIMAVDFLPKFAKAIKKELGGSAAEAARGLQGNLNRMENALLDLRVAFGEQLLPTLTKVINFITNTGVPQVKAMITQFENLAEFIGRRMGGQSSDRAQLEMTLARAQAEKNVAQIKYLQIENAERLERAELALSQAADIRNARDRLNAERRAAAQIKDLEGQRVAIDLALRAAKIREESDAKADKRRAAAQTGDGGSEDTGVFDIAALNAEKNAAIAIQKEFTNLFLEDLEIRRLASEKQFQDRVMMFAENAEIIEQAWTIHQANLGQIELERIQRSDRENEAAAIREQQRSREKLSAFSSLTRETGKILVAGSKDQKAAAAISQGIAVFEAGINVALAATKALNNPYPANLAFAASVLAFGGTLVGAISSQKMQTGGIVEGAPTGDRNLVGLNGGEAVLNRQDQRNLFDIIRGGNTGAPAQSVTINQQINGPVDREVLQESNEQLLEQMRELQNTGFISQGVIAA